MSFSTSKPVVGQLLPLTRANGSHVKGPTTAVMMKNNDLPPTPQLKAKEQKLQLKETLTAVSRREVMALAGISLPGVSLLLPGPAEARMTRAEIKNKILEKLRELREKFGLPKEKEESGEQTSSPQKDNEVEEKQSTPQQESEGGEKKSTPKPENEGGEKSIPELKNKSGGTPTPQPEDEGGDKSPKQESKGGDDSSAPQKKGETPLLPFFNLSEIEAEPLVEATLSL